MGLQLLAKQSNFIGCSRHKVDAERPVDMDIDETGDE
jgi:hypothetical protein